MDWTSLEKSKISKKIWLVYIKPYIKTLDMPQTKPIVSLENVVASASVDQKIDLIEITKNFQIQNTIQNSFQDLFLD